MLAGRLRPGQSLSRWTLQAVVDGLGLLVSEDVGPLALADVASGVPELVELLLVSAPDGAGALPPLVVAPEVLCEPLLVVPVVPLAVAEDAVPAAVVPLAVPVVPVAVDPVPDVGVAVEGAPAVVGFSTTEEGEIPDRAGFFESALSGGEETVVALAAVTA